MKQIFDYKDKMILAPMAGVTDFAFRNIALENGADLTFTEMVSVKGLLHDSKKTEDLLYDIAKDKPKAVQLFGHEADDFEKVLKLDVLKPFDILDINMGCPAPKIIKNGDGSALMQNIPEAEKIILTCRENFHGLVSVKFRKGYDNFNQNYLEFAKMCEKAGANAVTLHGRTRTEMYSGKVDLDAIKRVKDVLTIPVVGNGDVTNEKTYGEMKQTGVDAVMIGRGSLGRPFIFDELKGNFDHNIIEIAHRHVDLLLTHYDKKYVNIFMRKHLLWYLFGLRVKSEDKLELARCEEIEKTIEIFDKIVNEIVL